MTSNVPEEQHPPSATDRVDIPPVPAQAEPPTSANGLPAPAYSPPHTPGVPSVPHVAPGFSPAPAFTGQVAPMSASDERMWGMFAHLAPFVGAFVGLPFLGPLVVFLIYKDRSAFVRANAVESLNFQLTLLIGYIISAVLMLVLVGFFTAAIIGIVSIILQILAAVAANRGESYRYPLTIRFVS